MSAIRGAASGRFVLVVLTLVLAGALVWVGQVSYRSSASGDAAPAGRAGSGAPARTGDEARREAAEQGLAAAGNAANASRAAQEASRNAQNATRGAAPASPGGGTATRVPQAPATRTGGTGAGTGAAPAGCAYSTDRRVVIGPGSSGPVVRQAQCLLNRNHGHHLTVDGIYGPATEAAVRRVQICAVIQVDGLVGPVTWPWLYQPRAACKA